MFKGKDKAPEVTAYDNSGLVPGFEDDVPGAGQIPGNAVILQRVLRKDKEGNTIPVEINHATREKYEVPPEQHHRELVETWGHDPSLLSPVAPVDMTIRSGKLEIGPGTISFEGDLPGHRWDHLMSAAPILAARSADMVDSTYYDSQTNHRQDRTYGTAPTGHESSQQSQPAQGYYGEGVDTDEAGYATEFEGSPEGYADQGRTIVPLNFSVGSLREALRRHPKAANWLAFGVVCAALFNVETGRLSSDSMFMNAHNVGAMVTSPYHFAPVAKNATIRVTNDVMNFVHAVETVKNGVAKVGGIL